VFDFIVHVLNDKRNYEAYDKVEALRHRLLQDQTMLQVRDLGAGSSISAGSQRSVAQIAKHAAKSRKWARLLFRIARYYKSGTILELGTSLGISTAYLASSHEGARVTTCEGSPQIAAMAKKNMESLQLTSVRVAEGDFDETLHDILQELHSVDLAFIDGNHRLEPTIRYFEQILLCCKDSSIIILDDIHWSSEMEKAWQHIQDHPAVTATIDLFFIGLVVFRKEFREKQHFRIRYSG